MAAAGFGPTAASAAKVKESKGKGTSRAVQIMIHNYIVGDSLICLRKALEALKIDFSEVSTISSGMMGMTEEKPFLHMTTTEGIDIPFGSYKVEGLGIISPSAVGKEAPELGLVLTFERKNTSDQLWKDILDRTYLELKNHVSVFKSRAVKIYSSEDLVVPNIVDITKEHQVFLNADAELEVENNLMFPISHAADLNKHGIGGQRGILLHGKYGTGKTLIAYKAAIESAKVGRTFILCQAGMLKHAIVISRYLQPSTLFIEDMGTGYVDTSSLSALRNTLSGVDGKKGHDVVMILTTNFLEKVVEMDRSMFRPDRIDSVIEIPCPDVETTGKILKHFSAGWTDVDTNWEKWQHVVTDVVKVGATPAIIVEVLKRSKIEALKAGSLITSAMFMKHLGMMARQIELADPKPPVLTESPADKLASGLREVVGRVD